MTPDPQPYVSRLLGLVGDDDPLQILRSTPSRLSTLVATADDAARAWKPRPARWSITEIAAHLADAELVAGFRLRMIATANGTTLQPFDPDRWASTFDYASCDAAESARLFAAYRAGTLRMLDRLKPELMDNHGMHQERGAETTRHLIRLFAGHDRNHIQQIEANLADVARPMRYVPAPAKPEIPLELVEKLDLRVGTIVEVVTVPNADRLVRLTVDLGGGLRHVIAGLRGERPNPESLVGRQALFYYNVPRRVVRGHESLAMLCEVGYADGLRPALLEPEWPVPNGARAG
jgi:tRNA-binding EMAP/Myf-like protein